MSEYFSEPKYLGGRVKAELHLLNFATKANLKMQQMLIYQNFRKKLI